MKHDKERSFRDVLGFNEMAVLLPIACDLKPEYRRELVKRIEDGHPIYKKHAYLDLEKKHGFIKKNGQGDWCVTLAGIEFLKMYTQRKDIRGVRNQVTITD